MPYVLFFWILGIVAGSEWLPATFFYPLLAALALVLLLTAVRRLRPAALLLVVGLIGVTLGWHTRAQTTVAWPEWATDYAGTVLSRDAPHRVTALVRGHKVQLYVLHPSLGHDDTIRFHTTLRGVNVRTNPGRFDYNAYLRHHGYAGTAFVDSLPLPAPPVTLQSRTAALIDRCPLFENQRAVLKAMTVGVRTDIDADQRTLYAEAGASHLLALSGLHLSVLTGLIFLFFVPRLRATRPRWIVTALVILMLWGYALMCGLPYSLVRATSMMSFILTARLFWRRVPTVHLLVVAAFFVTCFSPQSVFDVGFQLSCLAVLAMGLTMRHLRKLVPARGTALCWARDLFCVSLVAWLGTMPLGAYYFHTFQPYSPLVSLLLVPATSVTIYLSLPMLLCVGLGATTVAAYLSKAVGTLFEAQWTVMAHVAHWPGVVADGLWLTPALVVLLYAILLVFALMLRLRPRWHPHLCILLVALGVAWPILYKESRRPSPQLIFYSNYRCPAAHFILSSAESYLLPARSDSVWTNMAYLKRNLWDAYALATPRRLDLTTDGLVRLAGKTLLQVHDDRWNGTALRPVPLDYLHLCRGYYAPLDSIIRRFRPRLLVLDTSLGPRRAALFRHEADSMGLAVWDIRRQGALVIPLR